MRLFRSFLTLFCFSLFGVGGLIIGTILFPILILFLRTPQKRLILCNIIHYAWIFFVKVMIFLRLIDVQIVGQKNLKNLKGHIIISNHPTLLDIVLLISIIPNTSCIVKGSLLKNFFIRHIIQRIYLVNSSDPTDFLEKGKELLSQGLNLVIFPEGTRTDNNQYKKIHRGFAQLALRSRKPLLPVQIKCTPLILGKKQKWYDVGVKTVLYHIHFLPVISAPFSTEPNLHYQAKKLSELVYSELFKRID